jgi:hypothetical protein
MPDLDELPCAGPPAVDGHLPSLLSGPRTSADHGALAGGGQAVLRDPAVGGGPSDQVHPVQFVTQVPQRLVGGVLDHPDEQEGESAELDVAADAVAAVEFAGSRGRDG